MSNPYQPKVQQKLSHCRMTIQWLEASSGLGRQEEEALLQGALVHLAIACRLYLRELGHSLSVQNPERIFQVLDLLDAAPVGAGVEELKAQGWVAPLFAAEREILNPTVHGSAGSPGPHIIAADTAVGASEVTIERVKLFMNELSQLVERQRLTFEEY